MTNTETKTPAKTTATKAAPAKAAKATPAKKAPAKKAAPKVTTPAARKLRWKLAEPKVDGKPVEQAAESEGHQYAITKAGDAWRATHTFDCTTEVLVEGGFGAAYNAAVKHNRERA